MTDTDKIRHLNDAFRSSFLGGRVMLTAGIRMRSNQEVAEILERVRTFNQFNQDNDPYGEHDFGSFEYKGDTIFWKIDYYDKQYEFGSENPADPSKTNRVLTIMRSDEY